MKHYTICYPNENDEPIIEILSEDQIISEYWSYWYSKMCDAFGKEVVDEKYTKQDCIDDWCIVHWATEVIV